MRKIVFLLLGVIFITIIFPTAAKADMGPKPSVVINFKGLEGKTYYATLLSSVKSTGPYSALDDGNQAYRRYQKGDEDYDIYLKFVEYQDNEGFYFLQFFKNCTETHQFSWTYYPPQEFKILLYFPETDSFIVSETSYERYAFDSYFTAKVSGTTLAVQASYDYFTEAVSLIVRILLTIAMELGIAWLFGFRERKQIYFITLVNVITQVALNLSLNAFNYKLGELVSIFFYFVIEIGILIVEAILFSLFLRKYSQKRVPGWKPFVYALTANAVSFLLGILLAFWLPGMF